MSSISSRGCDDGLVASAGCRCIIIIIIITPHGVATYSTSTLLHWVNRKRTEYSYEYELIRHGGSAARSRRYTRTGTSIRYEYEYPDGLQALL